MRVRVAFLGCVHANLPAFEGALDAARRWRADEVVLVGDLVNLGPHPEEVVALARKRRLEGVAGDHDGLVARDDRPPAAYVARAPERAANLAAWAAWTLPRLDRASIAYLKALPPSRRFVADGLLVHVTHGSPRSPWEGLGGDVEDDALRAVVDAARCEVLVVAHTHAASVRDLGRGKWFVNVGSVGESADGPEAALVLADFGARDLVVARESFDVVGVARDRVKSGAPLT